VSVESALRCITATAISASKHGDGLTRNSTHLRKDMGMGQT